MELVWKVDEGSKVNLKDYDPDYIDKDVSHDSAAQELAKLSTELSDLQEALYEAQHDERQHRRCDHAQQ